MAHVATITIDYTKVPGDLTDYVGLIVPDASAGYSALYALCLEGGGDIRLFKSDDTTELAREIVTFSVSAETGEIHYKYSGTLSSSVDTDIHVYADGSSSDYAVGATYGRNAVWVDYGGVWHLGEATTTTVDSTGNGNDGTKTSATDPLSQAEQIGNGQEAQTAGKLINNGSNTTIDNIWAGGGTMTMWLRVNSNTALQGSGSSWFMSKDNSGAAGWLIFTDSSRNLEFYHPFSGTAGRWNVGTQMGTGTMKYVALAYDKDSSSNNAQYYLNGAAVTTTEQVSPSGSAVSDAAYDYALFSSPDGTRTLNGAMDEVRLRNSTLSANWITTEYNNQNSYSTFYSVAAVAGGSAAQAARRGVIMMM